jgi:hypothetical protein
MLATGDARKLRFTEKLVCCIHGNVKTSEDEPHMGYNFLFLENAGFLKTVKIFINGPHSENPINSFIPGERNEK